MRLGKKRRYRFKQGRLSNWKKAIVKLHPEDKIEFLLRLPPLRVAVSRCMAHCERKRSGNEDDPWAFATTNR